MLGMLGFAAVWWERRHGISHQGYVSAVLEGFLSLGGELLFVSVALRIAMARGVQHRWWWAAHGRRATRAEST